MAIRRTAYPVNTILKYQMLGTSLAYSIDDRRVVSDGFYGAVVDDDGETITLRTLVASPGHKTAVTAEIKIDVDDVLQQLILSEHYITRNHLPVYVEDNDLANDHLPGLTLVVPAGTDELRCSYYVPSDDYNRAADTYYDWVPSQSEWVRKTRLLAGAPLPVAPIEFAIGAANQIPGVSSHIISCATIAIAQRVYGLVSRYVGDRELHANENSAVLSGERDYLTVRILGSVDPRKVADWIWRVINDEMELYNDGIFIKYGKTFR